MDIQEIETAVRKARNDIADARRIVSSIAYILSGNLQDANIGHSVLCSLKKELQNYDMHRGCWTK